MILVLLIAVPFAGGFVALFTARRSPQFCRWSALASSLAGLGLSLSLWVRHFTGAGGPSAGTAGSRSMVQQVDVGWIPQAGIHFHLGVDGLSLIMLMLTFALVALGVLASWRGIKDRIGLFHLLLLWTAASLAGVFTALDLFLFYFFFEMMLVPLYFLISVWGHEDRRRAAIKFFIYTQAGGLLMLVAILGLYFLHGSTTGIYTFDYLQLLGTALSSRAATWLMLGFFMAFAVKLPALPLHGWLPDAHSQAPTAGSVVLAGLLIKVGAYGMIRFLVPLFPGASFRITDVAMALGVAGIFYGAFMAFSQTDLKRLVAYTSVSHMGFVLLGIFAWNELALQGVVLQVVCHAFSTGGLFMLAGALEERLGTRDLEKMGGLWSHLPRFGGVGMFLAMAALGLPGLGNFVAEFLILLGTYRVNRPAAIVAAVGLVLATVYALWFVQRVFHGPSPAEGTTAGPGPTGAPATTAAPGSAAAPATATASGTAEKPRLTALRRRADLNRREVAMMFVVALVILWLGLYPQTLVRTAKETNDDLLRLAPPPTEEIAPNVSTDLMPLASPVLVPPAGKNRP
ncbi:MAG: NADH-quinone oxidoreductase subunit M [Actinobacteria bacterium]|nr:NADH-quinone oxidoreductase subunit M [Actinomycetota bacterium]